MAVPHLGMEQVDPLGGLQQLLLRQLPAPLRLLQRRSQLLHLGQQQVVAALQGGRLLLQVVIVALGVIQLDLQVLQGTTGSAGAGGRGAGSRDSPDPVPPPSPNLDLGLELPDQLLELGGLAVGVAQLDLHLVQISLHLLPQPHRLVLGPRLCIQRGLHGVHGTLVVAPAGDDASAPSLTEPGPWSQRWPSPAALPTHLRFSNSSSFSASFLSTSALIWFSSSWMRRVLLSSCSRAPCRDSGSHGKVAPGGAPSATCPSLALSLPQSYGEPPQCLAVVAGPP